MISWRELRNETEDRLRCAEHVADPRVEARWIIEDLVGADADELASELGADATRRGVARLDRLVERRLKGEPIQYVLGHWAFRGLDLLVDGRVLIPRPETEVVAGYAIGELDRLRPDGGGTVVDLGTGSGAIGLSIAAERSPSRVVLTDESPDALAVARANLAGLGVAGASVEVHLGSWFEALPDRLLGECDVIVANPPYVPEAETLPTEVVDWEPGGALRGGPDGLDDLRSIVGSAVPWLRPKGALVLEMAPDQTQVVAALAQQAGFDASVHNDLAGRDRLIVARPTPS